MNNALFFLHILLVLAFVLGALRMGKQALAALVAIMAVLANLFVVKQMRLFGLDVTCSDVFAIGGILGLNLLQEHFGKEEAKKAVRVSFFALVFFAVMSQVHLHYIPSVGDGAHEAFKVIFSSTLRIVAASFLSYYLVLKWDIVFFQWLQRKFQGKRLGLRLWVSLLISQAIDTVLFSFLGLYGIVDSVLDVLIVSYAVKCCVIAVGAPLAAFARRFVRVEA